MNKLSNVLYIFCILSVVSLMAVFACHEKPALLNKTLELDYCTIENYEYTSFEDTSAPMGITQQYQWTLENIHQTNGMILFYFSHQEVEVTIGDNLVYSLKVNPANYFSKGTGFGVARIPVSPKYEGKTVSVKIRPVYQSSIAKKLTIYYGNYNEIALKMIEADASIIVICILCIIIGLVMLLFSIYKFICKKTNFETVCMGIFAIFAGLWKLADVKTTALFMSNPLLMSALSILSIPIMVTSFVFYLRCQFSKSKQRLWTILGIITSILTLTIVFLQVTQIADIKPTLLISHFMILLVIIHGIICTLKELHTKKASHKLKAIFICILFCLTGTVFDIITFYYTHHSSGAFLGIFAFFIYIMYMGYLSLREAISLINQGRTARHYKELALHDELTGLYSRIFFKQYITNHQKAPTPCYLIMFDVNNLKQCNDTRGHSCGDTLLRNAAHLIREAFDGKCIRLSGDEFCVILENIDEAYVQNALSVFSDATKTFNKNHPDDFPIRIAYGSARFDKDLDLDLNDTLKRADKKMYEMKHQMKQK